MIKPILVDQTTGKQLWTARECAEYCNISTPTWYAYTAKQLPPTKVAEFNGSPLWFADEIKAWHAQRPGSPVPGSPTQKTPKQ